MLAELSAPAIPCPAEVSDSAETARARASWDVVQRAQAGDTAAFAELFDRYHDTLFKFILFRTGNRPLAEDLAQDVWVRAMKAIGRYTWQGRDIGAWLVTIARNLVADHFKSGRARLERPTDDFYDLDQAAADSPETEVVTAAVNVVVRAAIHQLSEDQRECIRLRFLAGLSVAETAEAMGKNEGAIKALQYRAVRSMARLLPTGFLEGR